MSFDATLREKGGFSGFGDRKFEASSALKREPHAAPNCGRTRPTRRLLKGIYAALREKARKLRGVGGSYLPLFESIPITRQWWITEHGRVAVG